MPNKGDSAMMRASRIAGKIPILNLLPPRIAGVHGLQQPQVLMEQYLTVCHTLLQSCNHDPHGEPSQMKHSVNKRYQQLSYSIALGWKGVRGEKYSPNLPKKCSR